MKFYSQIFFIAIFEFIIFKTQAQLCGSDTLSLQKKWEYGTGLVLPIHVTVDSLNPSYIFASAMSGGLLIFDVSNPNAATLANTIPISSFDNLYVMNTEQYSNYLYVALGNYFGTNVQKSGMAIVDVTDPLNPVITDQWENSVVVKGSAIVKVQGNYAYLGAMTDGLIILDVTDKSNIQFVSKFIPDPNWPVPNPIPSATPNARGMQVIGDIVYLCYDAGGLRIINIADKSNPKETGRYINQSALNKQQAYNNIVLHDNLAYIGVDFCGMEIVNVSDTSNITQVGWWNPWDCTSLNNLWVGSHGHGNEVTYDDQQKVVFMSAGASDLRIIDVSDPSNPDSCGGYGAFTDTLGAYGATVSGDKIFLSYIIAFIPYVSVWSGIKELQWSSTFNAVVDPEEKDNFSATPNPFSGEIELEIHSLHSSNAAIEITDALGRKWFNEKNILLNSGITNLHFGLPQLPDGLYFISLIENNRRFIQKVMKQD